MEFKPVDKKLFFSDSDSDYSEITNPDNSQISDTGFNPYLNDNILFNDDFSNDSDYNSSNDLSEWQNFPSRNLFSNNILDSDNINFTDNCQSDIIDSNFDDLARYQDILEFATDIDYKLSRIRRELYLQNVKNYRYNSQFNNLNDTNNNPENYSPSYVSNNNLDNYSSEFDVNNNQNYNNYQNEHGVSYNEEFNNQQDEYNTLDNQMYENHENVYEDQNNQKYTNNKTTYDNENGVFEDSKDNSYHDDFESYEENHEQENNANDNLVDPLPPSKSKKSKNTISFNFPWFNYNFDYNIASKLENDINNFINESNIEKIHIGVFNYKFESIVFGYENGGEYYSRNFDNLHKNGPELYPKSIFYVKGFPRSTIYKFMVSKESHVLIISLKLSEYKKLFANQKIQKMFDYSLLYSIRFFVVLF